MFRNQNLDKLVDYSELRRSVKLAVYLSNYFLYIFANVCLNILPFNGSRLGLPSVGPGLERVVHFNENRAKWRYVNYTI